MFYLGSELEFKMESGNSIEQLLFPNKKQANERI